MYGAGDEFTSNPEFCRLELLFALMMTSEAKCKNNGYQIQSLQNTAKNQSKMSLKFSSTDDQLCQIGSGQLL